MSAYTDLDQAFLPVYELSRTATMTSVERMYALYKAVEYVIEAGIPGDFAECGVWKGGSVMVMAATLAAKGCRDRRIWLYDTFQGMPPPTEHDVDHMGRTAADLLQTTGKDSFVWAVSPLDEVKTNLAKVDYPSELFQFVEGKVEDTIPGRMASNLALLRLDTDWYESTRHELIHMYPLLGKGGVLCIDDYGHWKGSRKAVDEYFSGDGPRILLNRVDTTGRVGIKT